MSAPVTLLDLKTCSCRWPVNDGNPFLFCGDRAQAGGPYCATHAARAAGHGTQYECDALRVARYQGRREARSSEPVE